MADSSEKRKKDHLALCATDRVDFRRKTTLLEQVDLIHRALPELSMGDIDLEVRFCGKPLAAPLWVSAITGGTPEAIPFNRAMAELAEQFGIGLCLGSLKPMLRDPARAVDFQVRDIAPTALVMGNIGATELAANGCDAVLEALKALAADGLTVHLNPAQELTQPGGDTDFRGAVSAIGDLVTRAPELPVVVKETGCGLSLADGLALKRVGVARVEVAGAGGTSWVGVETLRASAGQARLGEMLWDWGVPTAVSTAWMAGLGLEVVAAGGIRTGLDIARALALGASLTGIAAPFVRAFFNQGGGAAAVRRYIEDLLQSLRAVMLLAGARRPTELAKVPRVIGPDLSRWIAAGGPGS